MKLLNNPGPVISNDDSKYFLYFTLFIISLIQVLRIKFFLIEPIKHFEKNNF